MQALIFVNTLVLALDYHGQSEAAKARLKAVNLTLTVLFALETIAKV